MKFRFNKGRVEYKTDNTWLPAPTNYLSQGFKEATPGYFFYQYHKGWTNLELLNNNGYEHEQD